MTATKKKPHKRATSPPRRRPSSRGEHRLHVPPAGAFNGSPTSMSQAMVDRLFWRAGFGPSAADRTNWTGKPRRRRGRFPPQHAAGRAGRRRPTRDGKALDPTGDDTDLVLDLGRPHGAHEQPAGRAHDVLLAPPLGQLARVRLAAAAADDPERRCSASTATSPPTRTLLPRHGARGRPRTRRCCAS